MEVGVAALASCLASCPCCQLAAARHRLRYGDWGWRRWKAVASGTEQMAATMMMMLLLLLLLMLLLLLLLRREKQWTSRRRVEGEF